MLPDVAYHVAPSHLMLSILEHGLHVSDPTQGAHGQHALGQPAAVYLADVNEAMTGKYRTDIGVHDGSRIEGIHTLAPAWQQDRLNPTCWAVLQPIPARILFRHYTLLGWQSAADHRRREPAGDQAQERRPS